MNTREVKDVDSTSSAIWPHLLTLTIAQDDQL